MEDVEVVIGSESVDNYNGFLVVLRWIIKE